MRLCLFVILFTFFLAGVSSGFENNLAAAFSMIKGLERCNNGEEVLFISEISSGGIYVMITKCGWRI